MSSPGKEINPQQQEAAAGSSPSTASAGSPSPSSSAAAFTTASGSPIAAAASAAAAAVSAASATTAATAMDTYRDAAYNSESDEDYDPALDSSGEECDDEDEDIDYVDETDIALTEQGGGEHGGGDDDAAKVLDELVGMFVQNNGRAPTEEEMQEWMGAMKSLMVDGDGGKAAGAEGGADAAKAEGSSSCDTVLEAKKPAAE
eukprot:CAMPEP_0178531626 /NCGR_PEP_ID=MMETSP0696-20121128/33533_1 /TAXON_ID=265572 /ORGANISM="Extubocellulus spinifer, Strain CCMP396" /LENGTH=201 /DNA_ID=CAMNT_0020163553 /DNA_START=24 /DNA_END=629 /DNA_ORIENTATION=+